MNIHATADDPYIIEGLDVSTDGHGIVLRHCDHVIIRDCTVHDCVYETDDIDPSIDAPGIGILIDDCDNITIEDCTVSTCRIGIRAVRSTYVTVTGCEVHDVLVHGGIILENCRHSLVTDNYVHDNGLVERFPWGEDSRRVIGIYNIRGQDNEISYNDSIRNTSDGIAVVGQNYYVDDQADVWKGLARDITVHHNYIEENYEQGIWCCRARDCTFHDNEIFMGTSDTGIGVGLAFEFDVDTCEAYGNTIHAAKASPGAGLVVSHDNYLHDNTLYTFERTEFMTEETMFPDYDYADEQEKCDAAGIPLRPSSGNISENNTVLCPECDDDNDDGTGDDTDDGTHEFLYEDIHASPDDPYIIEGLDVTTDGDGIVLRFCDNVIIRDCTITHCAYTEENIEPDFNEPGMGLLVERCTNVTIEDSVVSYNLMGLKVVKSSGVTIRGNEVSHNVYHAGILLVQCTDCLVTDNTVEDNGFPERFYEPGGGKRIIGIYVVEGSDIEISHNRSCRNTSDGISVVGQNYFVEDQSQVWTTTVENVSVHDNYIADNYEQGIWCCRARNCTFYDNEIHVSCSEIGVGAGITFEFDANDCEVYGNTIHACKVPSGATVAASHDNHFHDNTLYTFEDTEFLCEETMVPGYDYSDDIEKSKAAGITHQPSSGNVSENNTVIVGDGQTNDNDGDVVPQPDTQESDGSPLPYVLAGAMVVIAAVTILVIIMRRR
jgi:parallel beta-helix repeat protein